MALTGTLKRMGRRGSLLATLCGVFCAAAWGGAAQASGYLQVAGPVPLRFLAEPIPGEPYLLPPLSLTDVTPMPPEEPASAPAATNIATAPIAEEEPTVPLPKPPEPPSADVTAAALENLFSGANANPLGIPAPQNPAPLTPDSQQKASDMLVVTPQMLIEYFKPGRVATNGVGASIFVPVGFRPPEAVLPSPSSKATYHSE